MGNGDDHAAADISSPAAAAPQKKPASANDVATIAGSQKSAHATKGRRKSAPEALASTATTPATAKHKQSVTPDRTKLLLRPPQKGDRFRTFYGRADDVFGKETERARGYFFGTVAAVSVIGPPKSKSQQTSTPTPAALTYYKLKIQFDDKSEPVTFDYPSYGDEDEDGTAISSLERLVPSGEGPHLWMGEITGDFAGDTNPARLDVGDLVFCNYQNQPCRYRGRIAAVSEDGRSCDIAYDDNEVSAGHEVLYLMTLLCVIVVRIVWHCVLATSLT